MLIWSRGPAATPFAGGTLCVAPPITRTAAQNSGGTSLPPEDCTGTYAFQFTAAMMSQAGLAVGDDVYSQYWSRDNGFAPPDNVGLTAGVYWSVCQQAESPTRRPRAASRGWPGSRSLQGGRRNHEGAPR